MRSETKEINIWSFYRAPVEVMKEIRRWREFAAGDEQSGELKDLATGEIVVVVYTHDWGDGDSITIKSDAPGDFFDRVVGRIVRLMSERSGYLKIRRTPYDEERLFTPQFKRE